jgi:hypothetical protein
MAQVLSFPPQRGRSNVPLSRESRDGAAADAPRVSRPRFGDDPGRLHQRPAGAGRAPGDGLADLVELFAYRLRLARRLEGLERASALDRFFRMLQRGPRL